MKWLIALLLLSNVVYAETSKVIEAFMEASEIYVHEGFREDSGLFVKPDVHNILKVFEEKDISPELLERFVGQKGNWSLPADDQFDEWVQEASKAKRPFTNAPEVALHAIKIDVIEMSDDFFKDDIYAYFFVTDGVIPTGKVTSIYKGIGAGEGFFFNEIDRAIFPLLGAPAKTPDNHLIVDYGIIESDGDDIKEMQKLSSIIIDIAIAVYSAYDPQSAQILVNLRKEIKALAEMLLSLNHDDRLVTGSFGYKTSELEEILSERSFVEFKKNHKKSSTFDNWEYDLHFRLLRK